MRHSMTQGSRQSSRTPANTKYHVTNAMNTPFQALFFQPVFLELLVQRVAVDAQPVGGLDLHVVAGGHDLRDQLPLHAVDDLGVQIVFLRAGRARGPAAPVRRSAFPGRRARLRPMRPRLAAQHGLGQQVAASTRRRRPSPRPARRSFAARGRCPASGNPAAPRSAFGSMCVT